MTTKPISAMYVLGACELTHGTLECRDITASRAFYEDILGLRCVQHSPVSCLIGGRGDTMIVGVKAGDKLNPQGDENRWLLAVDTITNVKTIHDRARRSDFVLHLGEITDNGGITTCLLQDRDSNWWEVSSRSDLDYQNYFERGDLG